MKTALDFTKIRSHKGSQNNAFEELICQLARLSPPINSKSFIRKEGAGGDAGVECFWILQDGSEHAWQAKYFLKTVTDQQWRQISNSVETAIKKHPKLKKYYICLPLDRTDHRQDNKESLMDKWNHHLQKWEEMARSEGRDIKFEFWGASKILGMLITDDPRFSGRALYWFNSPILQIKHFRDIAKKSEKSLGDRFSPEFNVELPIAKSFDGIGFTPNWYPKFSNFKRDWLESSKNLRNVINEAGKNLTQKRWELMKDFVVNLEIILNKIVDINLLYENVDQLKEIAHNLEKNIEIKLNPETTEIAKKINQHIIDFIKTKNKLWDFLSSTDMMAFSKKSMLLLGDAGVGKSHLLCDITLNRIKNNLPTLFLLGQHYEGGNPLKFISDSLDLNKHSYKEILGALDSIGEAHSTRTLLIIDAINEGPHKEDWTNHIINLITELKKYPYIAFVFSCRSTYYQYLLPPKIKIEEMSAKLKHEGFYDPNHQAIYKYLERQGIVPNIPVMNPEFFNPLFLKIYCKSLKYRGEERFSKGFENIHKIFECYIDDISDIINKRKKYRKGEKIVSKVLQSFALNLFPKNLHGLEINKAREIIKSCDPKVGKGEDLMDELLNEGILSEDIYNNNNPIIRFTYERFSDYFIAKNLVEKEILEKLKENKNLNPYFKKGTPIGDMFIDNKFNRFAGVIESLSICIADIFKVELYDLIDIKKDFFKSLFMNKVFIKTILWRSPDSITDRTLELLNTIPNSGFISPALDIFLNLSTKIEHPWNADFLHKLLFNQTLVERDQFWSTHLASSYNEKPIIKNLINWPYSNNLKNLEPECARLYAKTLIWLTTSSNREIRDKATKSAIIILSEYPEYLLNLMDDFYKVNDLYVLERVYAISYGVAVNIEDKNFILKIAEKTYRQIFKEGNPIPHILLRDYARCILEFAYNKKLISNEIDPESFRPPYKSKWPIENPTDSEINNLVDSDKYGSVHYSLDSGDFGIYTMQCVHQFSPTSLNKKHPETVKELIEKFIDRLNDREVKACEVYIKKYNSLEYKISNQNQELKQECKDSLNEENKEYFRWLFDNHFISNPSTLAKFSRKWAKRWVCKQVYKMGWNEELFKEFEKRFCSRGREEVGIERIGKKYQWIAFHKLLAHLADNVYYIGYNDQKKYEGPWQLSIRDIDPSCYLREVKTDHYGKNFKKCWWQPHVIKFYNEDLEQKEKWFKSKNDVPPFEKLLQVKNLKDNSLWTVLFGHVNQEQKIPTNQINKTFYRQACWFRINAVIISKKDFDIFYKSLINKNLRNGYTIEIGGIGKFLKEYPSCNIDYINDWKEDLTGNDFRELKLKHLCPLMEYSWEGGNTDQSIDQAISFYLPSKTLIDKLALYYPQKQFEDWVNSDGVSVFKNPSIKSKGPPYALIKTDTLNSWLKKDNLCVVWLIGGEKRIYEKDLKGKRHDFSGIYFNKNDKIEGKLWFLGTSGWG